MPFPVPPTTVAVGWFPFQNLRKNHVLQDSAATLQAYSSPGCSVRAVVQLWCSWDETNRYIGYNYVDNPHKLGYYPCNYGCISTQNWNGTPKSGTSWYGRGQNLKPNWRDLTTAQDELHRPASIVSLLLDTAPEVPVHVGSISDDQRFCAAGCDRDVRNTADGGVWGTFQLKASIPGFRIIRIGFGCIVTSFLDRKHSQKGWFWLPMNMWVMGQNSGPFRLHTLGSICTKCSSCIFWPTMWTYLLLPDCSFAIFGCWPRCTRIRPIPA